MARKLPKKSEVVTNIDWDSVTTEMNMQEWEASEFDGEERRVFLGTVFALTPSGKFYMPFACSNVDACPACHGRTERFPRRIKRRTLKKWRAECERIHKLFVKRKFVGDIRALEKLKMYRHWRLIYKRLHPPQCSYCEGLGSYEALLDQIYQEKLESEADEHGYYTTGGEGDPCDIFAVEYRDIPEEEDDGSTDLDDGDAADEGDGSSHVRAGDQQD